jgi:PAS domain S-box-containing protein
MEVTVSETLGDLCRWVHEGVGAAIVDDEALLKENLDPLIAVLGAQPPWSDLAVLVVAEAGAIDSAGQNWGALGSQFNVVVLDRPLRKASLISSIRAALRARRRQYDLRDHLVERELSAAALLESKERLGIALETADLGTWDLDVTTQVMQCSPRLKANFGLPGDADFTYDRMLEAVHPDDRSHMLEAARLALEGNCKYHSEYRVIWPDGTVHWLLASGRAFNENDGTSRLLGVTLDVTDRKRGEEALRKSEEHYRELAEALPQLVWTCLPNGQCDYLSTQWVAYTGIPESEQLGLLWLDLVMHPDDRERTYAAWMDAIADRAAYDLEYRLRRHDGEYRWFKTRGTPLRDDKGQIVKWLGTCTDINDLRQAREALRESEQRFRTMANSAPVMIWTSSADYLCDFVNEPWLIFTGRSLEEELGRGWLDLVHPDDISRYLDVYERASIRRESFNVDFRLLRHDGQWRWLVNHGVPRISSVDGFQGYIGSCVDITDRQKVEEELRASNRDLEEFAFVASHDLQEPLRTINIYTQLLIARHSATDNAEEREFADFIRLGVKRMELLIRDLLAYSRTVHRDLEMSRMADLNIALDEAINLFKERIDEVGAIVTREVLPIVGGDENQFGQVFQNLLSNALKYRKHDEPLRVHVASERRGAYWVIRFIDNGIGFKQEFADRVFGLFKRLHRDAYPGTGLGLAICKRVIERAGGTIWAESKPGEGSIFGMNLPAVNEIETVS